MTVLEIKERAVKEAEAAREIKELADQESRGLNADEALLFDKHLVEADRLEQEAQRQEKLESIEMKQAAPAKKVVTPELANGKHIKAVAPEMFRFGKLRAFKGPKAEANAYSAGKFILATVMGNADARQWCRDHGVEIRVQTEGINAAGGFLVPDTMERAIIDLREEYGLFRAESRVVPMSSDHTLIPRRDGGVDAYFVGEETAITASDKSWSNVELTAKKLGALTRMSTDLNEDAIINIADDLAREMAWAFAKKEDECGLDGDGTNTYGGMIGIRTRFVDGNHTAGYDEGTSPYTTWAHGTFADEVQAILALLPGFAMRNAKWIIHPAGKSGLLDYISLSAQGNTTLTMAAGALASFAGYPIITSAAMPALPTDQTVAVLLGDLSLATTFGERRGITIRMSADRYLEYDQIAIQATERFCIVCHDIGDNTNAGPVVASVGNT